MTSKQDDRQTGTDKRSTHHADLGRKHARNDERHREDRGGQVGSGDKREQADQEEFDRGGHRDGHSRDQAQ